jgi:hypothetical protein
MADCAGIDRQEGEKLGMSAEFGPITVTVNLIQFCNIDKVTVTLIAVFKSTMTATGKNIVDRRVAFS